MTDSWNLPDGCRPGDIRGWDDPPPCEDGHCNHKDCVRDENHCCWCGDEMEFDEGPEPDDLREVNDA